MLQTLFAWRHWQHFFMAALAAPYMLFLDRPWVALGINLLSVLTYIMLAFMLHLYKNWSSIIRANLAGESVPSANEKVFKELKDYRAFLSSCLTEEEKIKSAFSAEGYAKLKVDPAAEYNDILIRITFIEYEIEELDAVIKNVKLRISAQRMLLEGKVDDFVARLAESKS